MAELDLRTVLRTRSGLLHRVASLLTQLTAQSPADAEQLRGALGCSTEEVSVDDAKPNPWIVQPPINTIPGLNPESADEVWISKDGRRIRVGDMSPQHCAHALAMIMRNLRESKYLILDGKGRIHFKERAWPKAPHRERNKW